MKKILAIDFGTKRIGLALSHQGLAEPWQILENNTQVTDHLVDLIKKEKIEFILIGMSENKMAAKTAAFAKELNKKVDLPIEFTDETLSSHQVHHKLAMSKMKLKKRQAPIDHYAAAEFLQEWLDTN